MQLNAVAISCEPDLSIFFEIVTWTVVSDEEDLSPRLFYKLLEEMQIRQAVEDGCKGVVEPWTFFQSHCAENMCCLALSKGVNLRLLAYPGPSAM